MKFLSAITSEGKTEYLNTQKIIAITPTKNGYLKILMGAGLYYIIEPGSVVEMTLQEVLKNEQL